MSNNGSAGYRVLARKYRPQTFDDLIGQEAMVQTLSNAFTTGRVPQAWMLTGVRGVGKTTTARILARALNYEVPGEVDAPTIHLDKLGVHCQAIMASEHLDVIEMDAASHTGIDDIRDLTEAARYMPASARYKVYIIDEVHMLSKAAFNGLLKTLEEPPPHLKFVFATTEIRKVPVTVLSRCQRFDLKRIPIETLVAHLKMIAEKEGVTAEEEALTAIARAGEGSVRDTLSLFDQAIAFGSETVTADGVQDMLGLADFGRIIDVFEAVMGGKIVDALAGLKDLYDNGADPILVMNDLIAFTHQVTRLKLEPNLHNSPLLSEVERTRGTALAEKLSMRALSRAWQVLLKGVSEVEGASRPLAAADMVLIRLAHIAEMPSPDELIKKLDGVDLSANPTRLAPSQPASPPMAPVSHLPRPAPVHAEPVKPVTPPAPSSAGAAPSENLPSFEAVVALAHEKRDILLATALERHFRLVRFEQGKIEISPLDNAPQNIAADLSQKLFHWTGQRWMVALSKGGTAPTIYELKLDRDAKQRQELLNDPVIAAVMAAFPNAQITDVTPLDQTSTPVETIGETVFDPSDDAIDEDDEEAEDDASGKASYQ